MYKKTLYTEPSITEGVFISKMVELPDTELWSFHFNPVLARQRIADNPSLAESKFTAVIQYPSDLWQMRSGNWFRGYCTLHGLSSYLVEGKFYESLTNSKLIFSKIYTKRVLTKFTKVFFGVFLMRKMYISDCDIQCQKPLSKNWEENQTKFDLASSSYVKIPHTGDKASLDRCG